MEAGCLKRIEGALLSCCLALVPMAATAQAIRSGTESVSNSRVELFGGYSYFHPVKADINNRYDQPINPGAVGSATVFFGRYLGAQAEGAIHPNGPNDCAATVEGGPVARYQMARVIPFAHVLAGGARLGGPMFQPCTWGLGLTGGVGFDYVLPQFNNRIAIRPIQADYEYNRVDYGPLVLPGGYSGGLIKMNAYRLSAGVVVRFGEAEIAQPVQMSCVAQPVAVFPGEPVTLTASTLYLRPKKAVNYRWSTTGGKITGSGDTVQLDTTGLEPNDYTVTGNVSQGHRASQNATCTTTFKVKAYEPPTITCSASPAAVMPGESSVITSVASSPQSRQLHYSYSASSGNVEGTANTAVFQSAGAAPGTATISCNASDDLGHTATATTTIEIHKPHPVEMPKSVDLCTISFKRDAKRPARVNNEAKACLDDVALTLQRQSDSRLVIAGSHDQGESPDIAAERAVNTKLYLTREKGIDPSRVLLRSGLTEGREVENVLLPAGANYSGSGMEFDEGSVHPSNQPYGMQGKPSTKPAHRKKTQK